MKNIIVIFLMVCITNCSATSMDQPKPNKSADGSYTATASLNEGTIIYFNISPQIGGKPISIRSGASDAMKWAAGWYTNKAIFVMYSSDIGTRAWSADTNWAETVISPELGSYAKQLYSDKYDKT